MRNIIKYNLFESFAYKNGCIMLELPISNWDDILSIIDKEDIVSVRCSRPRSKLRRR